MAAIDKATMLMQRQFPQLALCTDFYALEKQPKWPDSHSGHLTNYALNK
jgi:hypothetical protein